jgi:MacB-like periplasmic core domain
MEARQSECILIKKTFYWNRTAPGTAPLPVAGQHEHRWSERRRGRRTRFRHRLFGARRPARAAGRLFTSDEDRTPGGAPLAVLGYGYWQTRLAGDPSVIGKQILVNDHELTIVGVAEKGFGGLERLFTKYLDSQRGATEPENGGCMITWSTMAGCCGCVRSF